MEKREVYLITGITGQIGGLLARELMRSDEYLRGEIDVIGLVRDVSRLDADILTMGKDSFSWVEGDCRTAKEACGEALNRSRAQKKYIIHCAAPTASAYMVLRPVETADSIVLGTWNMLELAKDYKVDGMVYLSSMEVYGQVADLGRLRREEELGNIPLETSRSCYPMAKRMAEFYCHSYYQEYGVPVKTARLAQTFGKGVLAGDNRVYMQFAKAVMEKRDIVLRTKGLSMGNSCASEDVVNAIYTILKRGKDGEVYNVTNETNTMTIREMAGLVALVVAKGEIGVRTEVEDGSGTGYAPDTNLRMSSEKLRKLGWKPTKKLVEMYVDVIHEISAFQQGKRPSQS